MSTIEVYYFAAAREAAGIDREELEAPTTLRELLQDLSTTHEGTTQAGMGLGAVLERCTFLIDGARSELTASLAGAQRVDCLPPFAGG